MNATPAILAAIGMVFVLMLRACPDMLRATKPVLDEITKPIASSIDNSARTFASGIDDSAKTVASDVDDSAGAIVPELNDSSRRVTSHVDESPTSVKSPTPIEDGREFFGSVQLTDDALQNIDLRDIKWFESADNPRIVSFFPSNEEQYKLVYHTSPSLSATKKIRKFDTEISRLNTRIETAARKADDVFASIQDDDGNPVIILAHSRKRGKQIVFPDGTTSRIDELHSRCLQALKRCLVLTCYGDDFEIDGNISAMDALKIWQTISKQRFRNVGELIVAARKERKNQEVRRAILFSWTSLGGVGSSVFVVNWEGDS